MSRPLDPDNPPVGISFHVTQAQADELNALVSRTNKARSELLRGMLTRGLAEAKRNVRRER
jgi:metal-responsive CopG/Arc/MetJ family transcriptional regulator